MFPNHLRTTVGCTLDERDADIGDKAIANLCPRDVIVLGINDRDSKR